MSNDNYKFQGVPISELIAPDGTTAVTKYSGLKYNTTTDPAAKVGTDSFVNVFKDSNNPLPSNIKAKEYNISNNTTIPEWANAFRFRIQTNAGEGGAAGNPGQQGNQYRDDGANKQGWTYNWWYTNYDYHTNWGGQGGLGANGGNGGAGGAGGKGKEVYSNFFPIDPDGSSIILNTTTGFKIKKGQTDVFNININAANNGQNGFPGGNGNDGNPGNDAQQRTDGQSGNNGHNGNDGYRETSANDGNLYSDGNGLPGAAGSNSNVASSENSVLISNVRNSTTGASSKIYFFKKSTTT
jgi:hypothetical protein